MKRIKLKGKNIYSNANYTMVRNMKPESQLDSSFHSNSIHEKFTVPLKDIDEWTTSEVIYFAFEWLQPRIEINQIIYGQLLNEKRIEEHYLTLEILNYMSEEFKTKVFNNQYLKKVYVCSIVDIKNHLERKGFNYEINAYVWQDIENINWEENVISVKIAYKDRNEKNKIWEEISSIVEKYETGDIAILTEIKRL
jgi:hypothetical protein